MIFSLSNSSIRLLMSSSEPVIVFDSLAWNTMFFTVFTLVGLPAKPHWLTSPSTSATDHWLSVR